MTNQSNTANTGNTGPNSPKTQTPAPSNVDGRPSKDNQGKTSDNSGSEAR